MSKTNILSMETPNDVKPELMKVTENFLKKDRHYFGIAAASLQNQLDDPKYKQFNSNIKLINAGIDGEKKTSQILREWIADKPDCILIDSISLPIEEKMEPEIDGEEGQLDLGDTDHLLIIGSTLVIIDSKNWKSKASYKFNDDGSILRSGKEFPGNRPRINQAKYLWEKYYNNTTIADVEAFVCISADGNTFIQRDRNWWKFGYKLVNQETLIYFLDKLYTQISDKGYVRPELVAKALKGLTKPYNKYKEKFGNVYNLATAKK